jgi:hypothetical protein
VRVDGTLTAGPAIECEKVRLAGVDDDVIARRRRCDQVVEELRSRKPPVFENHEALPTIDIAVSAVEEDELGRRAPLRCRADSAPDIGERVRHLNRARRRRARKIAIHRQTAIVERRQKRAIDARLHQEAMHRHGVVIRVSQIVIRAALGAIASNDDCEALHGMARTGRGGSHAREQRRYEAKREKLAIHRSTHV